MGNLIIAPAEDIQTLENVRIRITTAESQLKNMKKAVAAEEYTVNELNKAIEYKSDQAQKLEKQVADLNDQVKALSTALASAREIIAKSETLKRELDAALKTVEDEALANKNAAEEREAYLNTVQKKLDERSRGLDAQAADTAARMVKITTILQQLQEV